MPLKDVDVPIKEGVYMRVCVHVLLMYMSILSGKGSVYV